ncbi:hypothetical protein G6F22_019481 [Rhizopus arrhizus]|nr:hypothetical protein G6F22_019481 [Rhizopus arrhizus]
MYSSAAVALRRRVIVRSSTAWTWFLGFSATPGRYLTWHQSVIDPPNAFIRQQGEAVADAKAGEAQFASSATALTRLVDPTPEVRQIKKQLVTYKRADGVDLSFTLYTPPGYKEGQRVPAILCPVRSRPSPACSRTA